MAQKDYWNSEQSQRRQPVHQPGPRIPSWPACSTCCTRRLPEDRRLHQGPGRPPGDPDDRDPVGGHPRLPELHRLDDRGPAPPEPGHQADDLEPEPDGDPRRRPGRLSERATRLRRRRHDRSPGDRRRDDPARRPVLHPRWGGLPGDRWCRPRATATSTTSRTSGRRRAASTPPRARAAWPPSYDEARWPPAAGLLDSTGVPRATPRPAR